MSDAGDRGAGPERRVIRYCLVPYALADQLHEPLRRHFRDEPDVVVVVEQRRHERRSDDERRGIESPAERERRLIRNTGGRRIADRRAPLLPVPAPVLPRRFRKYAEQLVFCERLEPSGQHAEDLDTARLVTRIQAGDGELFGVLYTRYFDRVYGYLWIILRQPHEAEDATQQVFMKVLESMPQYERRRQPFRAWLFVIARNYALQQLAKHSRVDVVEPDDVALRGEQPEQPGADPVALNWISDPELAMFIERLPLSQRQVLMLRYTMGFSTAEIAQILGRSPDNVRKLQARGLSFLRDRLEAVGRPGPRRGLSGSRVFLRQARVVRVRRYALRWNLPTG